MPSRGNGRRSSADSLKKALDDMAASSKPLFYSTAFVYGSHTKILIIPYGTDIYHLSVYPVVLQNRPIEPFQSMGEWDPRIGKINFRSAEIHLM